MITNLTYGYFKRNVLGIKSEKPFTVYAIDSHNNFTEYTSDINGVRFNTPPCALYTNSPELAGKVSIVGTDGYSSISGELYKPIELSNMMKCVVEKEEVLFGDSLVNGFMICFSFLDDELPENIQVELVIKYRDKPKTISFAPPVSRDIKGNFIMFNFYESYLSDSVDVSIYSDSPMFISEMKMLSTYLGVGNV